MVKSPMARSAFCGWTDDHHEHPSYTVLPLQAALTMRVNELLIFKPPMTERGYLYTLKLYLTVPQLNIYIYIKYIKCSKVIFKDGNIIFLFSLNGSGRCFGELQNRPHTQCNACPPTQAGTCVSWLGRRIMMVNK